MGTKNNPGSFDCYANADADEPMFILLGRDPWAPFLVRHWVQLRRAAGTTSQEKLDNALAAADDLEAWCRKVGREPVTVDPQTVEPKSDLDQTLHDAVREGVREGVRKQFSDSYSNNPLSKLVNAAVEAKTIEFRVLLDAALGSTMDNTEFRLEISMAVREQLAKQLVKKFGGEIEKQVNALKSDPITRARIVLALEEIVKKPVGIPYSITGYEQPK